MDVYESLRHTTVSEMRKENTLSAATKTSWRGIPQPGAGVWRKDTEFRGSAFLGAGDTLYRPWGEDERPIREYIRSQEKEDERLDQLNLWR
jgi:hypothetical protein